MPRNLHLRSTELFHPRTAQTFDKFCKSEGKQCSCFFLLLVLFFCLIPFTVTLRARISEVLRTTPCSLIWLLSLWAWSRSFPGPGGLICCLLTKGLSSPAPHLRGSTWLESPCPARDRAWWSALSKLCTWGQPQRGAKSTKEPSTVIFKPYWSGCYYKYLKVGFLEHGTKLFISACW